MWYCQVSCERIRHLAKVLLNRFTCPTENRELASLLLQQLRKCIVCLGEMFVESLVGSGICV